MKNLSVFVIIGLVALLLILTKPTQKEIAGAALGEVDYTVLNKDAIPGDFLPRLITGAVFQTLGGGGRQALSWRSDDFLFFAYSDVAVAEAGSLKCLWLLRHGFCRYFSN